MKIGILGSGVVGQVLASGAMKHGHSSMLGTRDPKKPEAQKWLSENPGGLVGTFEEAARFGEMVILATLGRIAENALRLAGEQNLDGKTVIDATNPLADGAPVGGILPYTTGPNESLGESLQQKFPRAHIVKSFNSVGSGLMVNPKFEQGPPTMFLCGDHSAAKDQVSALIRQFGWEPYDCGGIIASRALEPLCILWCLPGFQRNDWNHAFKVLSR